MRSPPGFRTRTISLSATLRIDEVFQHMGGHRQVKNSVPVRELAHVPLTKRDLEVGLVKTTACALEHPRRNIECLERERGREHTGKGA